MVIQNLWHLPAFKPMLLQVIKKWQAFTIKHQLNFIEKALQPNRDKLFIALGHFLNDIYECDSHTILNVFPVKIELFRKQFPNGDFEVNGSADAGESLRTLFECIHNNLGNGQPIDCYCPLVPICHQKIRTVVQCRNCGYKSVQPNHSEVFTQIVYMQEWFDLAQDESNLVNEGKHGDPYH